MKKVIVYIASSLDGYIAKPGDDLGFLKLVEKPGEDYGYTEFTSGIDTIILGRKTYDWVAKNLGTSHYDKGGKDIYVITGTERPSTGRTTFYTGDLRELVRRLKNEKGKNIYCDGGAALVDALLKNDLVDEMVISVIPVLVGDGIRLFKAGRPEQLLELVDAKTFDTGLVQLHYRRKNL